MGFCDGVEEDGVGEGVSELRLLRLECCVAIVLVDIVLLASSKPMSI